METLSDYFKFDKVAVIIFVTIAFYTNDISAQIVPDATLPNNSRVASQENTKVIGGGTQLGNNLFHSFEQFSVPSDTTAYFNNTVNVENIITRITGKSISSINGKLRANGMANLLLINPNGIIFGENASLDIGGSFLTSTASSVNFADGTKFSATQPQTPSLLTISVPIGLQFGTTAATIRNQSQASINDGSNLSGLPVGLKLASGKTLALIGGDIILEGGDLTADSGKIELGSVAGNSIVSLKSVNQGWVFGYESVEKFQNIRLIQRSLNEKEIPSSVEVINTVDSGNIQIRANIVELVGNNPIILINTGENLVDGGDLNINVRKLILRDGAQISTLTIGNGAAGNLTVNASESVEIFGGFTNLNGNYFPSSLNSDSIAVGKAGSITINTSNLLIQNGGTITAESIGRIPDSQFLLPATGEGGNVTVNASNMVKITGVFADFPSSLRATTTGLTNAGELTISTKQLIVENGAEIKVSSEIPTLAPNITFLGDINNLGDAGEVNITANSILLDNQGKLISETDSANGGNINLNLKDLLLMRGNSQISTNAGKAQLGGDGGNIIINALNGFIVAIPDENNDITANAFAGTGGRVEINANGIFGMQLRSRDDLAAFLATDNPRELNPQLLLTNDITAISQVNPTLNGEVNINTPDIEPTKELIELPEIPLDNKISQVCKPSRNTNQSEFIFTRRGGLPPLPSQVLRSDSPLDANWVSLGERERKEERGGKKGEVTSTQNQIIEATGWIVDGNGDIFLTAGKFNTRGGNLGVIGVSDRSFVKPTVGCDASNTSHQSQNSRD